MLDKILDFIATKKSTNLTLNSTYLTAGSGYYRVRRNGLTADVLIANITFKTAIATNTTLDSIMTIPKGYRPQDNVYAIAINPLMGVIGYVWFLKNGTIGMRTHQEIPSGRSLYVMGPSYLLES